MNYQSSARLLSSPVIPQRMSCENVKCANEREAGEARTHLAAAALFHPLHRVQTEFPLVQRLVADLTKHWSLHLFLPVQENLVVVKVVMVVSRSAVKAKSNVKGEED
jgi:hypothetical protein